MNRKFDVYMMAGMQNGALCTGVTSVLPGRVWQHKNKLVAVFAAWYGIGMPVCFAQHASAESAIRREKQSNKRKRSWMLRLIEQFNPVERDLYDGIA
jgi:putative endonuclease